MELQCPIPISKNYICRLKLNPLTLMKKIILLLLMAVLAVSCVSRKKLTYLQDKNEIKIDSANFAKLDREKYVVQINDIINITVKSYSEELSKLFNVANQTPVNAAGGDLIFYLNGYSVSDEGDINMPVLGKVYVLGKNLNEIKDIVTTKLSEYFKEETIYVNVQLAGIRYTVIGDINSPGKYIIYQNQANIFEAIALAGDITTVGNRNEVQIIRQYPDGVKFFEIDLTDKSIVSNPLYFIQPNDIINVKPLPQRSIGIGTTGFQTFASILGVLASSLSVYLAIRNINR